MGGAKPPPPPAVRGGKKSSPPPAKTSSPYYIKKQTNKETTTDRRGGGSDSTYVEDPEYNPEDVYQPKHFHPSEKKIRLFYDESGSLEVLNLALREVDQDIGRGKEIKNLTGYTIGTIRNKREDSDLIGPPDDTKDQGPPDEEPEPELTEEEKVLLSGISDWISRFMAENGTPPTRIGATDFARYYLEKYGKPPALTLVELEAQIKEEDYKVPDIRERAV